MLLGAAHFLGTLATTQGLPVSRARCGRDQSQPILCMAVSGGHDMGCALQRRRRARRDVARGRPPSLPDGSARLVLGANVGSAPHPLIETSQPGSGQPASSDRQSSGRALSVAPSCSRSWHPDRRTYSSGTSRTSAPHGGLSHPHSTYTRGSFSLVPSILVAAASTLAADQPKQRTRAPRSISTPPRPGAPAVALVCAAREVLRTGDLIETMLRQAMTDAADE